MKRTWLLITGGALLAATLPIVLTGARPEGGFDAAGAHIRVRTIGHEVLRLAGDSTSPLPPVQQTAPGKYRISFPGSFSFDPDSLVALTGRVLAGSEGGADYIVNVLQKPTDEIVFGYAVLRSQQQQLVPCRGRKQPVRPYAITIQFREAPFWSTGRLVSAGTGALALGLLLLGLRRRKEPLPVETPPEPVVTDPAPEGITLGRYRFVPGQQCLFLGEEQVPLTGKEAQLLQLFAESPNVVIDRQRLQKIWDDEGVIVGRSLDVFVSRLRKKLEGDPALSLVNIHGKGYKLDVAAVPA